MRAKNLPFQADDPTINYHALADIEGMPDMSEEATRKAWQEIFRRYGATEKITKTYTRGLVEVTVVDRDGRLITTYTSTPDRLGRLTGEVCNE